MDQAGRHPPLPMTSKTPRHLSPARQKLVAQIASAEKGAEAAKKAAQTVKAQFKQAKKKFKEARRAAKAAKKAVKALKEELKAQADKTARAAVNRRAKPVVAKAPTVPPVEPPPVIPEAPATVI
ncbi:MAG: hypothetical protein ACHQ5A_04990, partial [Opitutales bacterium]